MRHTLPSQTVPLRPRGPQLFVDWRHVSPGEVRWEEAGKKVGIWDVPPPGLQARSTTPFGIRLEAQPAEKIGPLFESDRPWEQFYMMYVSTVLYEEGKYRMWYVVVPADHRIPPDYRARELPWRAGIGWMVCYAESDDGFTWRKPNLRLLMFDGRDTNFVYGRQLSPHAFASGSVFRDPHAPAAERYKLLHKAEIRTDDRNRFIKSQRLRFGDDIDPNVSDGETPADAVAFTAGAVSPDGIHWTALPDPVMMYVSNQLSNAHWDEGRGRYVGYFRMERSGRRCMGRAATEDFSHWPSPEPVLEAPLCWSPSDDIYHGPVSLYPESVDTYLMFATVYHRAVDRRDIHLAASVDGSSWQFVPGDHAVACSEAEAWCAGDLHAGYGIVPLAGDRVAVPMVGYHLPHKHPRWVGQPVGSPGWAAWEKGRLSALIADHVGGFSTPTLVVSGRELSVNFRTPASGAVLVELRDADGAAIPGFSFADADRLTGDSLDRRVRWRGNSDISLFAGKPLSLAFQLHSAHLFAFEFGG